MISEGKEKEKEENEQYQKIGKHLNI